MDLPKRKPMFYCEVCKEYVPDRDKHIKKRHKELKWKQKNN